MEDRIAQQMAVGRAAAEKGMKGCTVVSRDIVEAGASTWTADVNGKGTRENAASGESLPIEEPKDAEQAEAHSSVLLGGFQPASSEEVELLHHQRALQEHLDLVSNFNSQAHSFSTSPGGSVHLHMLQSAALTSERVALEFRLGQLEAQGLHAPHLTNTSTLSPRLSQCIPKEASTSDSTTPRLTQFVPTSSQSTRAPAVEEEADDPEQALCMPIFTQFNTPRLTQFVPS
jgi:hypothetical protein